MKMFRTLFILLLSALWGLPAAAQGLVFPDSVCRIGAVSEDDAPRVYRFRYENRSKEPVVILRVSTTCGCTHPEWSRKPIPAGGAGEVSVTLHPRGRVGTLRKSLFVYTNRSSSEPEAELVLTGVVSPSTDAFASYRFRMGPLRLRQQGVEFRTVPAPRPRVGRIEVANAGRRPLRLRAVGLPACVEFRTEPEVIAPDSVGDLVFTLRTAGTDLRGPFDAEVYLEGLGEPLPPSQRAIRLRGAIE